MRGTFGSHGAGVAVTRAVFAAKLHRSSAAALPFGHDEIMPQDIAETVGYLSLDRSVTA